MQDPVEQLARVSQSLCDSADLKRRTADACGGAIVEAGRLIAETFRRDGKILLCGNGGSAADCQHMAAEFVSRFRKEFERRALPALALTTDTSFLTAFTNDCGFEGIFERQIEAWGRPGDILIGISTSGNSQNVIRAIKAAAKKNMRTIALTGSGGVLASMTDVAISVPSTDTQRIQETHLAIEHTLCELVELSLFGESIQPGSR